MRDCKYEVVEAVSKNGKPYKQLQVIFSNGYVFTTFLTNEQFFVIRYSEKEEDNRGE